MLKTILQTVAWKYTIVGGIANASMLAILLNTAPKPFYLFQCLGWIPTAICLFLATKSFRENQNKGKINFGNAFLVGFVVALFTCILSALSLWTAFQVEPKLLQIAIKDSSDLIAINGSKFETKQLLDKAIQSLQNITTGDMVRNDFFKKMQLLFFVNILSAGLFRKN